MELDRRSPSKNAIGARPRHASAEAEDAHVASCIAYRAIVGVVNVNWPTAICKKRMLYAADKVATVTPATPTNRG